MTIVSIRDVNIYLQLNVAVTIDWNFNSMWTHACIRVKLFSQWIKSPLFQTKRNVSLERRDTIAVRFVSMLWFLIKWHSSSICVSAIRLMNKVELTIMDESSWLKKRARTRSRASVSLTFLYFSLRHSNTDVFFFLFVPKLCLWQNSFFGQAEKYTKYFGTRSHSLTDCSLTIDCMTCDFVVEPNANCSI